MAERRKRGLGRGLGALIPDAASNDRPVDVFFSGGESEEGQQSAEETKAPRAARTDPAASMQSSRRRKPKADASDSATTKTAPKANSGSEAAPAKTEPANTASATKAAGTSSTKKAAAKPSSGAASSSRSTSGKAASTKAASSKVASNKAAGSQASSNKAAGTKAASTKAAGTKRAAAKTTPANSNSAKSTASQPTASKSTGEKDNDPKLVDSKAPAEVAESVLAKSTPAAKSESEADPSEATAKTSHTSASNGLDAVPTESNAPAESMAPPKTSVSHAGMDTAATDTRDGDVVSADTAGPDGEPVSAEAKPADAGSKSGDEVFETHPGVYRSGREVFDEARDEQAASSSTTTNEVNDVTEAPASARTSSADTDSVSEGSDEDLSNDAAGVDSIPDTEFGEINVDLVDANPRQPRTFFDEDQLSELVHSIREIGVLQPVVVRQKPSDRERFELIMGERRLRATKDAGLETIPAIIRYVDNTDLLRDALLENLHRAELNPLEEAAAYGQLLEDFGCTQDELSDRIGRSRPQISNTLRLLRLPPLVQRRVAAGVISAGHARAILGLREPEHMEVLAQRIVAEGLSVRASEEAVVLLNRGDSMNVSRATPRVAPQFIEVADRLGDRLETKVNITVGKKKGKLSVEFANQDDLDRILTLLGVDSTAE